MHNSKHYILSKRYQCITCLINVTLSVANIFNLALLPEARSLIYVLRLCAWRLIGNKKCENTFVRKVTRSTFKPVHKLYCANQYRLFKNVMLERIQTSCMYSQNTKQIQRPLILSCIEIFPDPHMADV